MRKLCKIGEIQHSFYTLCNDVFRDMGFQNRIVNEKAIIILSSRQNQLLISCDIKIYLNLGLHLNNK